LAEIKAEDVSVSPSGSRFKVKGKEFESKLLGDFNVYNLLAGIALAVSQGIDLEICQRGIKK